jgi:hypothetical protein
MSITGGTILGAVAAAAFDVGAQSSSSASGAAIFDVLDPLGVTVALNWTWAWGGELSNTQSLSSFVERVPDGCADANTCPGFGIVLPVPPIDFSALSGDITQSIFLAPGSYRLSTQMQLATGYDHLGQGAIATNGSYQVSMSVVPVPAAVWLFGAALGALGVLRRKSPG